MATPILLCDTAGMTRARWLDCRMHGPAGTIPYTLGGSDVSVVLSSSPWTTPLELWRIKKGLMKPNDGANATAKEMQKLDALLSTIDVELSLQNRKLEGWL